MKKLMTLMLGLAFLTGTVATAFAQEPAPKSDTEKKTKKSKKSKKKSTEERSRRPRSYLATLSGSRVARPTRPSRSCLPPSCDLPANLM